MTLLQEPKPSLLSMFKQTKLPEPVANRKSRLNEPQPANKKPRLSADSSAAKSGPDKAGAAPQSEQQQNLKSRPVGSYDRPWRAFMKQPSGSKANSVQGQSSENAIAADTSKTTDPIKKLQVGAALPGISITFAGWMYDMHSQDVRSRKHDVSLLANMLYCGIGILQIVTFVTL